MSNTLKGDAVYELVCPIYSGFWIILQQMKQSKPNTWRDAQSSPSIYMEVIGIFFWPKLLSFLSPNIEIDLTKYIISINWLSLGDVIDPDRHIDFNRNRIDY